MPRLRMPRANPTTSGQVLNAAAGCCKDAALRSDQPIRAALIVAPEPPGQQENVRPRPAGCRLASPRQPWPLQITRRVNKSRRIPAMLAVAGLIGTVHRRHGSHAGSPRQRSRAWLRSSGRRHWHGTKRAIAGAGSGMTSRSAWLRVRLAMVFRWARRLGRDGDCPGWAVLHRHPPPMTMPAARTRAPPSTTCATERRNGVSMKRFWIQAIAQSSTNTTARAISVAVQKCGMR